MRVGQFSTFTTTMKIVICVCLAITAIQHSVTVQQKINSDEEPAILYWKRTINARNLQIPENSWLKASGIGKDVVWRAIWQLLFGIITDLFITPSETHLSFNSLNYTVQYLNSSLIWTDLIHDSVLLCCTTVAQTQDTSILFLVREILGIPDGCPVSAGEEKKVADIHLPFTERSLLFNGYVLMEHFRILTNMWEDDSHSAQKLFYGEFEIDDS